MTHTKLSKVEQKQELQKILRNPTPTPLKWDQFSLSFEEILEETRKTFTGQRNCLSHLIKTFDITSDPDIHFELIKEVINCNDFIVLEDPLYGIRLFNFEAKKDC